jgi:acyl-CoA synthetase (NDP forming)
MLEDCSQKEVKCIHLYTARFSETGRSESDKLEQEILKQARQRGSRLIGPNCMGVHYPRERIFFGADLSMESGTAGAAAQSGGVASEFARLAPLREVYYSKAISYGNALDFNECDYLDYFS